MMTSALVSSDPDVSTGVADLPFRALGIRKRYGGKTILDGITLDLPPGSVLGLLGRNGAGKSTLMKILMGLMEPDAGQSWVYGAPSLKLEDPVKERIAYVPQDVQAFNWMKVGFMLEFIGGLYPRWDHAYVGRELARLGIERTQALSKLSPGQRQSVGILRAMAARPELLVLDEPASALDPVSRRELLREIATRAADTGTSVLFSTHIVSDLERVASHVAILHRGRIVLNEALDDLKDRFARARFGRDQVPPILPGEFSRRLATDGTVSVLVRQARRDAAEDTASTHDTRAESLGLEDLFIEVTE